MGLSIKSKIWWVGMGFTCPKCGKYCGRDNSMEMRGEKVLRWCDNCSYEEIGQKDSHSYLNIDAILSNMRQFSRERRFWS
ncbi:hypothetical protein L6274_01020 [Candidatus Parcubacteria bacterium]|nr:hypothetical protein [Candidatus Parcubacteria bacterium]MCG2809642.1 hypothetical protein [Candidatus Portnoybacteria bacterium]